jgi:arylsulfate sulfotransferase
VTYNRADDSLIVSSREDFLICLDYATGAIKWILGDPEKAWYQFPSLRQYALNVAPGSLPPIGQHAVSITFDQDVLVFDNGLNSLFQQPPGAVRTYASIGAGSSKKAEEHWTAARCVRSTGFAGSVFPSR